MLSLENKESKLDLDCPIFVCYMNVTNSTKQRALEIIEQTRNNLDIYSNVTIWFVASNRDEIVCIYDGWGRNRDSEIKDLISEINTKIEIMSQSHSFEDFKIRVRDWRINELVDGSQENKI